MDTPTTDFFLMDTCVVSDFIKTGLKCLLHLRQKGCRIYILAEVFRELQKDSSFSDDELEDLGVEIIDAEVVEYMARTSIASKALSDVDKLCVTVAKARDFHCITNDKRMRNECISQKVNVKWGLEFIISICEDGTIAPEVAVLWGTAIYNSNKLYLTDDVYTKFTNRIKALK